MSEIRINYGLTDLYQISLVLMVVLSVIVVPLVQKHWHRRYPVLESMWWQLTPILAFSAVQIAYVTFNLFLGGLFLLIDLMLILDGYQRQQARLHRHHHKNG